MNCFESVFACMHAYCKQLERRVQMFASCQRVLPSCFWSVDSAMWFSSNRVGSMYHVSVCGRNTLSFWCAYQPSIIFSVGHHAADSLEALQDHHMPVDGRQPCIERPISCAKPCFGSLTSMSNRDKANHKRKKAASMGVTTGICPVIVGMPMAEYFTRLVKFVFVRMFQGILCRKNSAKNERKN